MRLQRLERHPTEEYAWAIYVAPNGRTQIEVELPYADWLAYIGPGQKTEPRRPATVPQNYTYVVSGCRPKYTNGQNEANLQPGQVADIGGWADGSGPHEAQPRRNVGVLLVKVPDEQDATKLETEFVLTAEMYTKNGGGEITAGQQIAYDDQARQFRYGFSLVNDELTRLTKEPL